MIFRRHRDRQFVDAVYRMRAEELPGWLARGADPNAHDGGWTVLGFAARSPYTDEWLVAAFLNAGAQPNPSGSRRLVPPLLAAAHSSTDAKIKLLLDAGADATVIEGRWSRGVVSQLVPWAQAETIRRVIRLGGWLTIGWPLHRAICYGRVETVAALLEEGTDPQTRDSLYGMTPGEYVDRLRSDPERGSEFTPEVADRIADLLREHSLWACRRTV